MIEAIDDSLFLRIVRDSSLFEGPNTVALNLVMYFAARSGMEVVQEAGRNPCDV